MTTNPNRPSFRRYQFLLGFPNPFRVRALIAVVAFLVCLSGAAQAQSALDGFDPNANGNVRAIVVQSDGKILIGGQFTTVLGVARNYIARLNPDGTLDNGFNPNANDNVRSIVVQADGKVLASGDFTNIGGQPRNRIARLDATTGAADSFDPNANSFVRTIAVQADGRVLAGGNFTNIGGQTRNRIARLDSVTGAADSFDPNANSEIYSIVVQADGKILTGGEFINIGGQFRRFIARLDAITGAADSFDPNASDIVFSIAVQADGKILAGGAFTTIGGQTRNRIARLDTVTGAADSFDPNANGFVISITVHPDGKILVGGQFTGIGGETRNNIARLDAVTGLADSFNPSTNAQVLWIAVQADAKILIGGFFTTSGGQTRNRIARLETDGSLDRTLNLSTVDNSVLAIAIQPDGKILIGGRFSAVLGVARNFIARLNPDGTLDIGFNPNADSRVDSIAVQSDGKILVGGEFNIIGGQPRNKIARLDATTGLADSFNPNPTGCFTCLVLVSSIAVQPDGKILIGGYFTTVGGQPRNNIARLDAATGLADSFNPNATGAGGVLSIAVQTDGKVLAGGGFFTIGGQTRNHIARLNSDGTLDTGFNANAGDWVYSIVVQTDGKILVGGDFQIIGGQPRNYIARLDAATGLADSFNPNANSVVTTIAVQSDGKILAGGAFFVIMGQTRNRIARLNPDGTLDIGFNPDANQFVRSIAVQSDGKILVGGFFSTMGGQPRNRFARLSNDTAVLQDLAVMQTMITWTRNGAGAQFRRVSFEQSIDNGATYTPLGSSTPSSPTSYSLTGLTLLTGQNLLIRARGYYRSGNQNGSESIQETVKNVFFAGAFTSSVTVTCPTTPQTYTGSAQTPCTASYLTSDGLSGSLTVSYTDNTNVGTAGASASYGGDANHEGSSGSNSFMIGKASSVTTVTCSPTSLTYTGSAQTPCTATATGAGGLDVAVTVVYGSNINAGTATANATYDGDANHNGNTASEKTFTINKAPTTTVVTFESGPYVFRGTAFTATAQVTGAGGLNQAESVSYTGNCTFVTAAGGCSATATYAETANYLGSTDSENITIVSSCTLFDGFKSPIGGAVERGNGGSSLSPVRTFKLGSTIPVKFSATCSGTPLTTGIHVLHAQKWNSGTSILDDPIDATPTDAATTGIEFRLTGTEWHYNLDTKNTPGFSEGTWLLKATLYDGSTYSVWVAIKK